MHTQTLQTLRAEVEAASTLHLALGRIATRANPSAPTGWTGPLLEELEDLTDDDGGFSHAGIADIRRRSASALAAQFRAVVVAVEGTKAPRRSQLQHLVIATLGVGTGNASLDLSERTVTALVALAKSGDLQLERSMRAAMLARDGLPQTEETVLTERPRAGKPGVAEEVPRKVAAGSAKVAAGSTKVARGSTKVAAGSAKVARGSTKVAAGSPKVAAVTTKVTRGSKVAAASTKVAAGFAKGVAGSEQPAAARNAPETGTSAAGSAQGLKRKAAGKSVKATTRSTQAPAKLVGRPATSRTPGSSKRAAK